MPACFMVCVLDSSEGKVYLICPPHMWAQCCLFINRNLVVSVHASSRWSGIGWVCWIKEWRSDMLHELRHSAALHDPGCCRVCAWYWWRKCRWGKVRLIISHSANINCPVAAWIIVLKQFASIEHQCKLNILTTLCLSYTTEWMKLCRQK